MSVRSLSVAVFALSVSVACGSGSSVPEHYGVYSSQGRQWLELRPKKMQRRGDFLRALAGVDGPSGPDVDPDIQFIVYLKAVLPQDVKILKLDYVERTPPALFVGEVLVRLWVPEGEPMEFEVTPIRGHEDMYQFKPRSRLANGFYAMTFRGAQASELYDFVVGRRAEYPSYAERHRLAEAKMKEEGQRLIGQFNRMFNSRDFHTLDEVYRPEGRRLSEKGREDFILGTQRYADTAGTLVTSNTKSVEVDDAGTIGKFRLETSYSRSGTVTENAEVRRIGESFYLTALR